MNGPLKKCVHPGCRSLVRSPANRCDAHQKQQRQPDTNRPNANQRGYNYRWQQASKRFLMEPSNALCVECLRAGKTKASACVDHKIPHRGDQELFWDEGNWQALCNQCHARKTARGE